MLPVLKEHEERYQLCAYCPKMCRFSCPVAEADSREALTPWAKMSAGFLLSTPQPGISLEAAFETSWGCTACGHCTEYCAHGNEVPLALAAIRAAGIAKGLPSPIGKIPAPREASLPAVVRDDRSAVVWLHGCSSVADVSPTRAMVRVLEKLSAAGVRVASHEECCGASLFWAGRPAEFDAHAEKFAKSVAKRKKVVVSDAGCAYALRVLYPRRGHALVPEVVHVSEWIADFFRERALKAKTRVKGTYFWHDPCQLARWLDVVDEPRAVLVAVLDEPFQEFTWNRRDAMCCGGGALLPLAMPDTAQRMAERRVAEAVEARAEVVTSCPTCLGALKRGGVVAHDLLSIVAKAL